MSQEICRLCLCNTNLHPIFITLDQSEEYSNVLLLTTGLEINMNDGLPQKICTDCKNLVNSALRLRNQSQSSEVKLFSLGFIKLTKEQNINANEENEIKIIDDKSISDEITEDSLDNGGFPELKIEIEMDRLTDNGENLKNEKQKLNDKLPMKTEMTRKEKRAMYMDLVEGVYEPKGPVKCKVCKKSVRNWSCFTNHVKLHLGFKFVCEYCGKSFVSMTQLKRHCRSYHGMQRELACKLCNYLALDTAQLVLHERRVHTGERPYVCDLCAASYFSRRCLVQHIEGHRTEASVQCPQCSQLFKSSRHLARHRYSAHRPRSRKNCPLCSRLYTTKYFRSHMAKHHPGIPF